MVAEAQAGLLRSTAHRVEGRGRLQPLVQRAEREVVGDDEVVAPALPPPARAGQQGGARGVELLRQAQPAAAAARRPARGKHEEGGHHEHPRALPAVVVHACAGAAWAPADRSAAPSCLQHTACLPLRRCSSAGNRCGYLLSASALPPT